MAKNKTLHHGMLLDGKKVMDNAMCDLGSLRELVPEKLHAELDRVLAIFEDTLCECDVSDRYEEITRMR